MSYLLPTLSEPWENGVLVVYKPRGYGSLTITKKIKRLLGLRKAGHLGTLDPFASGVLPILCGKSTKLMGPLMKSWKHYCFSIHFGKDTTTGDPEGEIVRQHSSLPSPQAIQEKIPQFLGDTFQTPPLYSAVKIQGVPAYKRARKGETFTLQEKPIHIKRLELLGVQGAKAFFWVQCSPGTYIRCLGQDIAHALGACGHVADLCRTAVGGFFLSQAFFLPPFDSLRKLVFNRGQKGWVNHHHFKAFS